MVAAICWSAEAVVQAARLNARAKVDTVALMIGIPELDLLCFSIGGTTELKLSGAKEIRDGRS
jgi:hypothetical protein